MSLDPGEYDLDELRRRGDDRERPDDLTGEVGVVAAGDRRVGGDTAFRDSLHRDLLPLEAGEGTIDKPYLPELPESYAAEQFLFEWLEFLRSKAGYQGTSDALSYYESIGWLTPAVENTLGEYMRGVEAGDPTGDLDIDDHLLSLAYVAKLASMR